MKKMRFERQLHVVARVKSQHIAIERHNGIDALHLKHGVSHAERACAETRDRAAGLEWFLCRLSPPEGFDLVLKRVLEAYEALHLALLAQRPTAGLHRHFVLGEPCREGVKRCLVRRLPAKVAEAIVSVIFDDDALLAVVHAERHALLRSVDLLHAEEAGTEMGPIVEALRRDPNVPERLDLHGTSL